MGDVCTSNCDRIRVEGCSVACAVVWPNLCGTLSEDEADAYLTTPGRSLVSLIVKEADACQDPRSMVPPHCLLPGH
jgi:hypothetical protein